MSNKVSAQQLDTESTRSEKAFATQKKDRVRQTDGMRSANFKTVQQH